MKSGESMRVMHPLFQVFQVEEGGSIPTSPLQMRVEPITFECALRLNEIWHSRLPRMGTGCIRKQPYLSFVACYKNRIFAVAIWSNPIARNLPQKTWLELRRLAVAPDAPQYTCSWMLGVMARKIRRLRPWVKTLVSYSDTKVHQGTIYKAAGWKQTTTNRDGNWTRRARPRPVAQSIEPKLRWERHLGNNIAEGRRNKERVGLVVLEESANG